jgi:hypothetical protein
MMWLIDPHWRLVTITGWRDWQDSWLWRWLKNASDFTGWGLFSVSAAGGRRIANRRVDCRAVL